MIFRHAPHKGFAMVTNRKRGLAEERKRGLAEERKSTIEKLTAIKQSIDGKNQSGADGNTFLREFKRLFAEFNIIQKEIKSQPSCYQEINILINEINDKLGSNAQEKIQKSKQNTGELNLRILGEIEKISELMEKISLRKTGKKINEEEIMNVLPDNDIISVLQDIQFKENVNQLLNDFVKLAKIEGPDHQTVIKQFVTATNIRPQVKAEHCAALINAQNDEAIGEAIDNITMFKRVPSPPGDEPREMASMAGEPRTGP